MDVYLVPVGRDRFECYYEAEQDDTEEPVEGQGFFARMRIRFNEQLKEAERARHQKTIEEPKSFFGRIQKRSMRWIAERVAEQRLLWRLRTADTANLHAPGDLATAEADTMMRTSMKRDADRHRNRAILHALILIPVGAMALIPGPNVLGYLFSFTAVGHFLAWRGAVRALHVIRWTIVPDRQLTELRRAFSLDAAARHRLILEVAQRLHLPRMATFVERMSTT